MKALKKQLFIQFSSQWKENESSLKHQFLFAFQCPTTHCLKPHETSRIFESNLTPSIDHSSSSSSSPSSVSSSSINSKHQQLTPTKASTPIKSIQPPVLLSSLSAKSSPMAKKSLDKALANATSSPSSATSSSLLITSKSQQKITQRIAHELSKFRMSAQLGENDEDFANSENKNTNDDEDDRFSTASGLVKSSNEIWLEYGCI